MCCAYTTHICFLFFTPGLWHWFSVAQAGSLVKWHPHMITVRDLLRSMSTNTDKYNLIPSDLSHIVRMCWRLYENKREECTDCSKDISYVSVKSSKFICLSNIYKSAETLLPLPVFSYFAVYRVFLCVNLLTVGVQLPANRNTKSVAEGEAGVIRCQIISVLVSLAGGTNFTGHKRANPIFKYNFFDVTLKDDNKK